MAFRRNNILTFNGRLAEIERDKRRRDRKRRRRERRERLAALAGLAAGEMFGTRKVGWLAVAVAAIVGVIVVLRML